MRVSLDDEFRSAVFLLVFCHALGWFGLDLVDKTFVLDLALEFFLSRLTVYSAGWCLSHLAVIMCLGGSSANMRIKTIRSLYPTLVV